ncbi:protein involved in polysaccharide export, contains SLBB domain of the beta-grasp fold [Rhizobacter sp. OV335]|nr:protein involved in polysaccharide export, contains SLBB domain of the beta-grasp fold [Rhizobacter sp. OV335]
MTVSCLRAACVLAVLLPLHAGLAAAADELPPGGTFSTPAYATAASAPNAAGTGYAPTSGSTLRNVPTPGQPARRDDDDATARLRNLPPPKPSEFQRFVEAATGRQLQPFGSNFFAEASRATQPVDNVPVTADYTVGPGDEVLVRAWGSIDVDYRSTVDRNGQLNLPKIGSFTVSGIKASELEGQLRAQIGRLYRNFNLSVSLGKLRGLKVFVVGPARLPGVYTVPSQATMLSAVVAAGGPGPNGSMRRVQLRRDNQLVSELDIYDFLVRGDKSKDLQLAAGDVLVFQPVGPRVALSGALDNAAIYELKGTQEPVAELLRYAGGSPVLTNPNRVQLERIDPAQSPAARYVEDFKLDATGLQHPLRDGDIVTLLTISPKFSNAVTLKGHVAQPLRYAFTPGMRIRDLIPDKEALVSPDFYRRKNLLVQVLPDDDDLLLEEAQQRSARNAANAAATTGRTSAAGATGAPVDQNGVTEPVPAYVPANDPYAVRDPNRFPLTEGERARRRMDRLAAAESKRTPATLFDELNWDYAVVERLSDKDLSTQVIPFNLGKAVLQGDADNNIELKAGDVVTIYSQKDIRVPVARQTRLVSVEGEVGAPGVYQLLPGETLAQLITRAGGFTPQAYVYGLEFSREETRKRQRENLQSAIARLEVLSAQQAAREAANRRDEQAGGAAISSAATQAQMTRLSRVQPNGRVALELTPETTSVSQLPDVPLENADRIVVPSRPGFVTVAGAVVNNNAFLWKPNRTVGDYVKLAGLDEAAEPSNMFVLRADGTVSHANERRGWFGSLESQALQPGDAVVVPNQLDYESWGRATIRNLKDFSQIFYQFGLGAAAIKTLRGD